ncbi:MAG: universal stress protein [Bacteroidales bacterium]|nr:universal stress protein [Bacteroidales bacterium]
MTKQIITIATETYSRAILIQASFEEAGITSFLSNVNQIQANVGEGVNIKIGKEDEKEALRILNDIRSHFGEEKSEQIKKLKSRRRILVPVDFSEHSVNACMWALGVADRIKAEIQLIHVYFNPATTVPNFSEHYAFHLNMDKFVNELVENAKYDLNQLAKRMKEYAKKEGFEVKIHKNLISGVAGDTILEECNNFNPALVIMGTKGKGEKMDYVMGGVTNQLIDSANVPVLTIPECAHYKGAGDLHNVMYATAFDDSDFQAIGRLLNLMQPFNVMLHCVHIDAGGESEWDHVRMSGLKSFLHEEIQATNTECQLISNKNVFAGLQEYIDQNKIDIISVNKRKRSWLSRQLNPSLIKDIVFHAELPILIFHSR